MIKTFVQVFVADNCAGMKGIGMGSGGMSKTTMAMLGLLAYKDYKGFGGQPPTSSPDTRSGTSSAVGGLSEILGGLFGGVRSGGAQPNAEGAGNVLRRGLENLMADLHKSGSGEAAQSWVSTGPNQNISNENVRNAVGGEALDASPSILV